MSTRSDLKTTITKDGQRYVDEPILVRPKLEGGASLRAAVQAALDPQGFFADRPRAPITVGHERVLLRWMKPDGRGGLVPRDK